MKPRTSLTLSVFALATIAPLARAQSVSTAVIIGASNLRYATEDSLSIVSLFREDAPDSFTSGSVDATFAGMNRNDESTSMNYVASGYGRSDYGRLRAFTTATLENSFFNENNAPFYNSQTEEYNPDGTPDYFDAFAAARFSDTLQFGGQLQSGYLARYVFQIDGLVSGDALNSASIGVGIAGNETENGFWVFPQGDESPVYQARTFATRSYAIDGRTPQTIDVAFATGTSVSTERYDDGRTVFGTANFTSTAILDRIEITDAAGNLVDGVTVTSGSGTSYRVNAVPEPASMAALAIGGLALLSRRRRR